MRTIILKPTELVEKSYSEEMAGTERGGITHDGWTCGNVHYIDLFATYNNHNSVATSKGNRNESNYVEVSLLSCSPMTEPLMGNCSESDERSSFQEAVRFTGTTHVQYLKHIFRLYNIEIGDWVVCHVAENCTVSKKVTELLGIPHDRSKSHILSVKVSRMVKMVPAVQLV